MLGICNGFQVLCEAGLLPGALLPNAGRRFVCRQVDVEVVNADTPFTARVPGRRRALDPGQAHDRAATTRRRRRSRELEAQGQIILRYRDGHNPNGSRARHRRRCPTEAKNVMGLMPHPEHAVDPLTGSVDGGRLFESLVAHVDELAAA